MILGEVRSRQRLPSSCQVRRDPLGAACSNLVTLTVVLWHCRSGLLFVGEGDPRRRPASTGPMTMLGAQWSGSGPLGQVDRAGDHHAHILLPLDGSASGRWPRGCANGPVSSVAMSVTCQDGDVKPDLIPGELALEFVGTLHVNPSIATNCCP